MDKYKELNRIKAVINSLNEEEFFLSDIAIITEYLRKIYRRKKRKQDYKMKMREKRCLLIEKRRAIDDKPFLGWLIINKEKYLQIAEKYGGWFSSLKFKELYSEFKNEPITKLNIPESFNVLVRELKGLGLDVELLKDGKTAAEPKVKKETKEEKKDKEEK